MWGRWKQRTPAPSNARGLAVRSTFAFSRYRPLIPSSCDNTTNEDPVSVVTRDAVPLANFHVFLIEARRQILIEAIVKPSGLSVPTMEPALSSYLRTYRLRWGLTQAEVAFLLGVKSGSVVSRIERRGRRPALMIALGCEVLFGSRQHELFPGLYSEVEEQVLRRAYAMYEELQGSASKRRGSKLDFLEDIMARAVLRNKQQPI